MSKNMGYNKFCWIDINNKKADCADKYENVQTTCKREKVFTAEPKEKVTSKSTNIIDSVRDTSIDYNYFRASNTQ